MKSFMHVLDPFVLLVKSSGRTEEHKNKSEKKKKINTKTKQKRGGEF